VVVAACAAIALLSGSAGAADDAKKIERTWKSKCSACHGADGKGQTEKGKKMKVGDMTTAEFKAKKDDDLKKAINEGVKTEKDGVKKEMDPFKDEFKPEQIDALLAHMKTFK
jgi:mono/diheme cytochrome c family protein